jgi:hypothetical protein
MVSMSSGPIILAPPPRHPFNRISLDVSAPQNPHPSPGCSINRSAKRVRMAPMPHPKRRAHRLLCSPAPEDAGAPSTLPSIAVRITIASITAGSHGATSAPMASPAASPGASCSASPATAISLKPMARSFTASAPQWSSSCVSSRVWPRVWASEARRGCWRSIRIPCSVDWSRPRSTCTPFPCIFCTSYTGSVANYRKQES